MFRTMLSNAGRNGVSIAALLYASAAGAQTAAPEASAQAKAAPDEGGIADIVVTAQRRAERLQEVPVTVAVVTSEVLEKAGVETTRGVQNLVPGLNVNNSISGFRPFIRGVGTTAAAAGNENSVSTYIDGVYVSSMNGAMLDLANIASIEVLKGPQGTLFGRNATGGVIQIKTKDPTPTFGGSASVKFDNYETLIATGYLTGGLGESVAADLAVYYRNQGQGYGHNLFTGSGVNKDDSYTVRAKVLFTPSDADRLTLIGDYTKQKNSGATNRPYPGTSVNWGPPNAANPLPAAPPFVVGGRLGAPYQFPANGTPWDVDVSFDPSFRAWYGGVSLGYEHDFDWATLSTLSAYRKSEVKLIYQGVPAPINAQQVAWILPEQQFSQEVQLSSSAASAVKWIAGFYYLDAEAGYDPFVITGLSTAPNQIQFYSKVKTRSPSLYGQATMPLGGLGNTNVTAGLRYTIDKRSITGFTRSVRQSDPIDPFEADSTMFNSAPTGVTDTGKTFKTFTWRLGIDHKITPDNMIYATYSRGFKAGTYNTVPPGGPLATPTAPEYLDSYEVGVKNTLFGGRLTLNAAAFLYEYRNLQVSVFTGGAATTVNAAAAEIKGVDIDINAQVTDNLRLTAAAAILDHKFLDYQNGPLLTVRTLAEGGGVTRVFGDLSGRPLPYTADAAFNAAAYYTLPTSAGDFDANINFSYNSGYSFEPSDAIRMGSFIDLSGSIGWILPNGTTRIAVFGRNLTNEVVPNGVNLGTNPGGYVQARFLPPRTYGISVSQNF